MPKRTDRISDQPEPQRHQPGWPQRPGPARVEEEPCPRCVRQKIQMFRVVLHPEKVPHFIVKSGILRLGWIFVLLVFMFSNNFFDLCWHNFPVLKKDNINIDNFTVFKNTIQFPNFPFAPRPLDLHHFLVNFELKHYLPKLIDQFCLKEKNKQKTLFKNFSLFLSLVFLEKYSWFHCCLFSCTLF